MICSIGGCASRAWARGWCNKHYKRWRKFGDPLVTLVDRESTPEVRFWSKVDRRGADECWLWTDKPGPQGYGSMMFEGRATGAHRLAYFFTHGTWPDETLDHMCHTSDVACFAGDLCPHRRCCNPAHLEDVAAEENIRRGRVGAPNARKTHCPQGHPYAGDNLAVYQRERSPNRSCRICNRAAVARNRAARRKVSA